MEFLVLIGIVAFVGWIVSSASSSSKPRTGSGSTPRRLNEQVSEIENIKLSEEQQATYDKIENTNGHFFITGKAGTGKSELLKYFKRNSNKRYVVVAPTGVAALNVGGQTIHSLFKVAPAFIRPGSLSPADQKTNYLLKNIDAIVIDEISMVRADLMDAIDQRLRYARRRTQPFGGAQMIMFGDLYQLPPVVGDPQLHKYFMHNHGGFYFFNAYAWKDVKLTKVELSHIFRQSDPGFKAILNAIRNGSVDQPKLDELNARANVVAPTESVVTLASTNRSVDGINTSHLEALSGDPKEYVAEISGKLDEASFPTEEVLRLKIGAQVMLIKNDKEKRWVNGSLGTVAGLSHDQIHVDIEGITYPIQKESWSKIRYYYDQETRKVEEEIVSSFTQFPLRLAWAMTIHKSQGKTYGSIIVDMGGGAFAHGQAYVALSRCKSLEGLFLTSPIMMEDIIVDPAIIEFMTGKPATPQKLSSGMASPSDHKKSSPDIGELSTSEKNRLDYFLTGPERYALSEKGKEKVIALVELVPKMSKQEESEFTTAYAVWKEKLR